MNEREQLQARLIDLQRMLNKEMGVKIVPTRRAAELMAAINVTKTQIEKMDLDAVDQLNFSKLPMDEALEIIAMPILADVMNDFVAGMDGTLRKHGCRETVFSTHTKIIRKHTMAIIDSLATSDSELVSLIDTDDTIVDAVRKKLLSYIRQRLSRG